MPDFPRTMRPRSSTPTDVPPSLRSTAHTGSVQTRPRPSAGRVWTETWPLLRAGEPAVEEFFAFIEQAKNRGTVFDIQHLLLPGSGKPPNGAGGGAPRVRGADQRGESIATDGWTPSVSNIVRAGDVITIAGHKILYKITDTTSSNPSGVVTLTLNPAVFKTLADNALIKRTNNTIQAVIAEYSLPTASPNQFYGGVSVTFQEKVA